MMSLKFLVLAFIGSIFIVSACKLANNDRVLFIGTRNTLIGAAQSHGYVNIIKQEAQALFQNVTIGGVGFPKANAHDVQEKADKGGLLRQYLPNTVVLNMGWDSFEDDFSMESLPVVRYNLEALVISLLQNKPNKRCVLLAPVVINNERVDIEHDHSEFVEAYININKQVAKDYGLQYLGLHAQIEKYLERNNIDAMDHSQLTFDGSTLNERGHELVARSIMQV